MNTAWIEASPRGLDESHDPEEGTADRAQNLRWDQRGVWTTSYGIRSFNSTVSSPVHTVAWFSQHNGARRWLLYEEENGDSLDLRYLDPKDLTPPAPIETGRTRINGPWQRTQYLADGNWLYYFNGYDEPARWNGRRRVRMGYDKPPPPPRLTGPEEGFLFSDELFADYGFGVTGGTLESLASGEFSKGFEYWHPRQRGLGALDSTPVADNGAFMSGTADQTRRWVMMGATFGGMVGLMPVPGIGWAAGAAYDKWFDTAEVVRNNEPQDVPCKYGYAVSWVNDRGMESPISEVAWVTFENPPAGAVHSFPGGGVESNGKKGLRTVKVQLPPAPANVHGVRVWRTRNLAFAEQSRIDVTQFDQNIQLYLHSEHPAGAEFMFVDDHPDDELGALLDRTRSGLVPKGFKVAALYQRTMFVAACPEYPNRVYFSAPLFIEQFPELQYFNVGDRDSGEVVKLHASRGGVIVFKRRGIYIIRGNPDDGFRVTTITEDLGCSAPNTVTEVPGVGLFFLSDEGPYALTADGPVYLGNRIRETWDDRVNVPNLLSAQAIVNHRDRELWIQLPADGDWRPSLGLVFHYAIGEWTTREGYPINCMVEGRDLHAELYVGLTADGPTDGLLGVYTPGVPDIDGTDVSSLYRTSPIRLRNRTAWLYWEAHLLNTAAPCTVTFRIDRKGNTSASDNPQLARDTEAQTQLWDSLLWVQAEEWPKLERHPVRFDIHQGKGFAVQAQIVSTDLALGAYRFGYTQSRGMQQYTQEPHVP